MKGTHFPKTKKQLSDLERELLSQLLIANTMMTAKKVAEFMNWDIRQTTSTLSNLVGMDLCIETDQNTKLTNIDTHEFSSQEPIYGMPENTVYHKRAEYARDRVGKGITLWHLLHGESEYGEKLWPFRPVDRVQFEGKVVVSDKTGNPVLKFASPKELGELLNQSVRITIDLL